MFLKKFFLLSILSFFLVACNGFFDKDNLPSPAPLKAFKIEAQPKLLWKTNLGSSWGRDDLKLNIAHDNYYLFTASVDGTVTAINKNNGRIIWRNATRLPITSGPGVGEGLVIIGSRTGDILALEKTTGKTRWLKNVSSEVLAKAAVGEGLVIIKTIDGYIYALNTQNGDEEWKLQQVEPNLILRGASAPLLIDRYLIIGFANGNLNKFTINGHLIWVQPVAFSQGAFAIQRMIDIDADPIMLDHRLFAATYQGQVASFDWATGRINWSHDISSYTGMTNDNTSLYITDAKSYVWSFSAESGLINWKQEALEARGITAPITIKQWVIVGDEEGYLHWLNKQTGRLVAREYVGSGIFINPITIDDTLYLLNNKGDLMAFKTFPLS